jgi:hypothetical protein
MSSTNDSLTKMDLADLIMKIGCDKRKQYYDDNAKYLDIIYENWGFEIHNKILHMFDFEGLSDHTYPRRAPSYDYYWTNVAADDADYPDEYKDLIHKVFCLRVVSGREHQAEIVKHLNTIVEKYGNDAYADAINILSFEQTGWL